MQRWVPWVWGWLSGVVLAGCTEVFVEPAVYSEGAKGLTVSADGEVYARPDVGVLRLGVEVRDADVRRAVAEVSKRMSLILSNLKAQGVDAADLQTRDFSIHFEEVREQRPMMTSAVRSEAAPESAVSSAQGGAAQEGSASPVKQSASQPTAPRGYYRVSHGLQILVREVGRAGDLLALAMEHGANQMWGIEFRVEDPTPFEAQARQKAVEQAFSKARALAQASGVQLGRVIDMRESQGGGGPIMPLRMKSVAESSVPLEAGEVSVRQTITITFALEPGAAPADAPANQQP